MTSLRCVASSLYAGAMLLSLAGCAPVVSEATAATSHTAAASNALAALSSIAPNVASDRIADAPIKGFQQMVIDGHVVVEQRIVGRRRTYPSFHGTGRPYAIHPLSSSTGPYCDFQLIT